MLGKVFGILIVFSFIFAGITGNMDNLCSCVMTSANEAVELSFSLLGMMCLWNGAIRTLDHAGFTKKLSKIISPLLRIVFPKAYKEGYAVNDIAVNYSANLLGLGNAALPSGIKVMTALNEHNGNNPFASDEMITFAVLNTVPIQIIPTTIIAMRNAFGSANPYEILLPTWICNTLTFVFAVITCKLFSKSAKSRVVK